MPQVINSNVASLNTQRALNGSQGALSVALQRLSSGLRINSARDDAAGLAISERFTAQIRGLNQAVRNANDGISLAQTAEGALNEITNNLQRIRELAVQSRNATNSPSDRAALQVEVIALKSEIDRVAAQTSFNGVSLLNGAFVNQAFQVGANAGQSIAVNAIANAQVSALGNWMSTASANSTGASGAFTATILDLAGEEYTLSVGGVTVYSRSWSAGIENIAAADIDGASGLGNPTVQSNLAAAGFTWTGSATGGDLVFTRADGAAFNIVVERGGFSHGGGFAGAEFGDGAHAVNNGVASTTQTGFALLEVATTTGADEAIRAMDGALTTVNTARASLGAVHSRFESTIANLQATAENLSASRSRILDADFAMETAALTRAQILQQSGVAMLAQANALPSNVLSLLRG